MKIIGFLGFLLGIVFSCYSQKNYVQTGIELNKKGTVYFMNGDFPKAIKYYQLELNLYLKNEDKVRSSMGYSNVGAILFYQNNIINAVKHCQTGLKLLQNIPNDTVRFRHYKFLGLFYDYLYQKDSSLYFYDQAAQLIASSKLLKNSSEIISFYENRGSDLSRLGYFGEAEVYFKKALQSVHLDSLYDKGTLYGNIGNLYLLQKKYALALTYYQKALQQPTREGNKNAILLRLSKCEFYLGRTSDAQKHLIESYVVYQTGVIKNDLPFEAAFYQQKGLILVKNKRYTEAKQSFEKAVTANLKQTVRSIAIASLYQSYAQLYDAQNQPRKALEFYQKALVAAHETFSSTNIYQNPSLDHILTERELFSALMGKANAFRQFYTQTRQRIDLEAVLKTYQLAIQLAEKMRRSYQSAGAKLFFTENYYVVYEQAIQTAQELYQITKKPDYQNLIFDFYEKSRAAALADIVRDTDLKPKTINAALLAQEKGLYQQITGLQAAIKRSDSAAAVKFKAQLVDKEIELDRLTKRFERGFPAYYQLKYDTKTAPATTIQQQLLNPDAALVQYFLTSNQLYILVLTREQSKVVVQPIDSTFRQTVSKFRGLLSLNPGSKVYDGNAYSSTLYFKLITPVLPFISSKKRLLIVRDAELNYLPFDVLSAKSNDYLLNKYAISYAYSVGLLVNQSPLRSSNNRLAIAPFAGNIPQKTAFRGAPLVPLPASEQEVRQIGGDVYVEKEATKKCFLEQYRAHGIIHFATHALTDDKDPMRSFVAFYPDGQEYRLFTDELYNLDLKEAQLVVLSACETGAGKLQRGEGVMSLARAFAYAGAQSVATTLWNANDEVTAYISMHFHKYIKDGLSLDEALQRAKLDFLQSDLGRRYDHPYYWANMVLIGRTDPIQKGIAWWWFVIGAGVLLTGLIWKLNRAR